MARKAIYKHATQVNTSSYPDDGSSPVGSDEWNEAPDQAGMYGNTPATSTITIASGVATVTDSITVVAAESGTTDTLDKLAITNTNQFDLIYLFADAGDTITLTHTSSLSADGQVSTVGSVNETLSTTTPTILIRKGNYWYGYGGGLVNAVSDIGDVTISSNSSGELLKWNGSAWINNTLAEADIGTATAVALNTAKTGITSGQISAITANTAKITYPSADSNKLSGIEASSTADQSGAEIKTAYEAVTNAYTDTKNTKLSGIETSADVTDSTNVNASGALMLSDSTTAGLGIVIDEDAMGSNLDTKVPTQQSVVAYVASQITAEDLDTAGDSGTGAIDLNSQSLTLTGGEGIDTVASSQAITISAEDASATNKGVVELATTTELNTGSDTTRAVTVAGIEASARSVKLDAVEALADVTDATNVNASGATMNTDADVKANTWVIDENSFSSNLDTKVPTQQSIKAYVDTEVATALSAEMSFKGDYNASSNSPDLDTSPSGVKKGDMYVVSAAGTFFTNVVLEIGDVLVAKVDSASAVGNWVVVQVNVVAASLTVAGNVELATIAETNTGSDATRAVTPDGLQGSALQTKVDGIETSADVTDTANVNSAAATTVGTITTGTWQGTTVAVNQGGTGVTASTGTGSTVLSASPTFTGTVITASVDIAGNNIDNIQNLIHDLSTTTVAVDFTADQLQEITISATATFTCSSYIVGLSKTIKILDNGSGQTLAFPSGWKFVGAKPTTIAASKTGILTLTCFTTAESGVVAAYAVEA